MAQSTRRQWLRGTVGTAAVLLAGRPVSANCRGKADVSAFGMERVGTMPTRPSREIDVSPLGVGFEVLDRRMFNPHRATPWIGKLGAKWARCQTGWARTETRRGVYEFGWLDDVVDGLLAVGVQPWFNLGYGNPLYTGGADAAAVGWAPVWGEETRGAWVRYTRAIAGHFAGRVRHWEIWNEPNIPHFWKPTKPNPADYVALLRMTTPVIRDSVRNAVVVGGATAGIATGFLRACMECGLGGCVDRISYHPYRPRPEAGYRNEVEALRRMIAEFNPAIQIWQGENGCPSKQGGSGAMATLPWTETLQAKWLLRRILTDLLFEIELTSYFVAVDLVGYRGKSNDKGLLRGVDYTPKPAYFAYQRLCAVFDAETQRRELPAEFGGGNGRTVAATFSRDGRLICAYWQPTDLFADLFKNSRMQTVHASLRDEGVELDRPVLADPMTGSVYRVGWEREGKGWRCNSLPLVDWPLLLTDATVFDL